MSRISSYTTEIADLICERIADGKSLRSICANDSSLPDRLTVNRWLAQFPEFATKYAHAREEQAECHHADMDQIEADVASGDLNPQAARVILENKRWRMEKLKPKVYGKSIDLNHGGQKDNPIMALLAEVSGNTLSPKDDE